MSEPTEEQEIIRALNALVPTTKCTELRIAKKPSYWMSGFFDGEHLNEMARQAILAETTYQTAGVYFVLNSINPALMARRNNRFETYVPKGTLTSDNDIVNWDYLYIDLDTPKPAGISSTDEEVKMAEEKADAIIGYLCENGFPLPFRGMSGNGAHLLYKIDLPRSEENDVVVKTILYHLDAKFSDANVAVDTSVHNPSRVCKLYGTWARKGDNSAERPHRRSAITFIPEPFEKVGPAELWAFYKAHPLPEGYGTKGSKKKGEKVKNPKDVIARHPEFLKTCGTMVAKGECDEAIIAACRAKNSKFPEPKIEVDFIKDVTGCITFCRERQAEVESKPGYIRPVIDDETGEITGYRIDEMKYSDFLKKLFHTYFFNGELYAFNSNQGIYQIHHNQIETHVRDTVKEHDIPGKLSAIEREIVTHLKSMGNETDYPFIGKMGTINVANGSLDLETGMVSETTWELMYDYRIETAYKEFPNGTPELDAFLKTYNTTEPIDILAKSLWQRAYHDSVKELTVLYGPKDSGKTTVAEFVQSALDGSLYRNKNVSRTLLHELLQRFGYSSLEGKLLNFGDDLPDMFIKNAGRINEMVGSVVRHIEKKGVDGYDATVTAYYMFTTNNLPPLDDDDSVIWGKIHLVNFKEPLSIPFVPREQLFTQTLREQLLYRAVLLARGWSKKRYVNNQTADEVRMYWHEASTDVDAFLVEATEYDPACTPVTLEEVKNHYARWCAKNGRQRHIKYLQKKIQPYIVRRNMGNYYAIHLNDFAQQFGQTKI